ncbi:MAG: hypothetical protein P8M50_00230 [Paracoccaceae bacterium]|nr:hypothetical protein [Paracoccaceae bacterium]
MQMHQLDNKLFKIKLANKTQETLATIIAEDQVETEEILIKDQLELNIKEKSQELPKSSLETDFLSWDILLKALHFPNDKNDSEGFIALEIARKNNTVLQLLQVSEDFLNLLAQDGIYLDDLKIDSPSVEAWLNFVKPEKKHYVRRLSCVGIDEHIKKLKSRTKSDTVFRDTTLMLMRRFDKLLREKLATAEDHQIFKIADTRSGKAFLIVGQISDIF